ncbi:3-hydroxyisobutyrate dehydrogenase [Macrococcus hajekii]|uniref:3-hydroxyisobutyrate dehydrogenase n=1 Tax=Macrococcus hajekii TaxID=198482 RepID=A0A4R6BJV6_9STAP|nr:NAD(P)-binding domain-containing protein [Macrococcus hajekii]TDM02003.1 3-hydroxyisobutyrate dehydrogenase [Macrococcus hajekii]GGB09216.1 3-hydroxyisobutyrate dehydrogenase [Macrococcus hajekii]
MNIGIIGAGPIGTTLSQHLFNTEHDVKIADTRSIKKLEGKDFKGKAVTFDEVIQNIDVLIISLPFHVIPTIKEKLAPLDDDTIIVDTTNYYPFRDGNIQAIDEGKVESVWVAEQIEKPVIKAFNHLLAMTLQNITSADGSKIAMAISGDNQSHKDIIAKMIHKIDIDVVDNGDLNNSWRHQPGSPAYCTELNQSQLERALQLAYKSATPIHRDEVMNHFRPDMQHEDIVAMNRKVYGAGHL